MAEFKISDEVVCYCSKCKLELNARVVRVEAGNPKRVLCLTCKVEHAYRKSAPAKAGEGKPRKPRANSIKADQEAEWREMLDQGKKPPKAYAMDQVFLLNDRIDHQTFGVGLVVSLVPPDKINVFFQDGLKLMKCGT